MSMHAMTDTYFNAKIITWLKYQQFFNSYQCDSGKCGSRQDVFLTF
jgi:hypothetical protein